MARHTHTLALDGMSLMPAPNAAIWFSPDGYDPQAKGINGRRVAGESFLRGFFRHGGVSEFVSLAQTSADHAAFASQAAAIGVTVPLRPVPLMLPQQIAPVEVLFYPAPISSVECWRRAPHGNAAWALCGITHTTATQAVMASVFDLRSAPQMPWDAVICTSAAVQTSLRTLMELAEAHLADRFPGAVLPARPLLPIIPLGIHCDDYRRDPASGTALRDRLGIAPGDVVSASIARLDPDEKFDPFPLFLAMEAAAPDIGAQGTRQHLILCGQFRNPKWREVFEQGAARLMPSVGFHVLDGGDPALRSATLSAADIFVFPIDNVQETFGLAPVEAMAAGLPVIVSDWDGMKETVTHDAGLRIPTEMPGQGLATYLSQRYLGGTDGYLNYIGQLAALTRIDVRALTRALVTLGTDPALRRRMGEAGQARARALYDWGVVIPQMQALWAEQAAMLAHARKKGGRQVQARNPALLPVGPAPDEMFKAYPSRPAPDVRTRRLAVTDTGPRPGIAETLTLRRYSDSRRLIDRPERLQALLSAFASAGPGGMTVIEAASASGLSPAATARASLWLLKYHFLEEAAT
jgi:glycosyltransferase involved in cell wall biosynthesis